MNIKQISWRIFSIMSTKSIYCAEISSKKEILRNVWGAMKYVMCRGNCAWIQGARVVFTSWLRKVGAISLIKCFYLLLMFIMMIIFNNYEEIYIFVYLSDNYKNYLFILLEFKQPALTKFCLILNIFMCNWYTFSLFFIFISNTTLNLYCLKRLWS